MKSRVLAVMAEDGPTRFPYTAALLDMCARLYGQAVKIRAARFADGRAKVETLGCKVVSVGNLTVGGTGKTPMTLYLAGMIRQLGYRVAVVSRGYKGRAEKGGGVVSDGRRVLLDPAWAGDEPFLLAASLPGIPVIVGRDRYRAGLKAVEGFASQVVVLDDAFQHLRLKRDLDIVLLDQKHPLGNGRLLPRGPLREAPTALHRADAIVLTRSRGRPRMSPATGPLGGNMERPPFQCTRLPVGCWTGGGAGALLPGDVPAALDRDASMLAGRRVLAFSGIADNRAFVETVKDLGATLGQSLAFGDHHPYTAAVCREICRRAVGLGVDSLVTTYKDYVKIAHLCEWSLPLAVLDVRISFESAAAAFQALVRKAIEA